VARLAAKGAALADEAALAQARAVAPQRAREAVEAARALPSWLPDYDPEAALRAAAALLQTDPFIGFSTLAVEAHMGAWREAEARKGVA
jgi:hypothetical protein